MRANPAMLPTTLPAMVAAGAVDGFDGSLLGHSEGRGGELDVAETRLSVLVVSRVLVTLTVAS